MSSSSETSTFQVVTLLVLGFIALVAILIFAGIIPGAGGLGRQAVGGEIELWGTFTQSELNRYFSDLNESNKETVRIKYVSKNASTYLNDLIEAFARGTGPDLFFVDPQMLNRLTGKTADISYGTYPERDFLNNFSDGSSVFTTAGGLKALPVAIDPLVMYYNKSLYTGAGIATAPKTWQEFILTLPLLNRQDERNNFKQTAAPLGEFRNITNAKAILSALLFQAGNPITEIGATGRYSFELNGNYGYTPTPAEAASAFFLQFSNPSLTTYSWNRSMDGDKDMFVAEKSAVYFGMGSELSDITVKNPHLNFDITTLPQKDLVRRSTYGNFYGLAIAGNSKKKALAQTAAIIMSGTKEQDALTDILGLAPARRDLLATRSSDPRLQAFKNSAVIARSWVDPDAGQTSAILQTMLENVQTGQVSLPAAISTADGQIDQLFIEN